MFANEHIELGLDLQRALSIFKQQSKSYEEHGMILLVTRMISRMNGFDYEHDTYGNIRVFKVENKDKTLPCVVAHMDTVHSITTGTNDIIQTTVKDEIRWSSKDGIGGDDKCGIIAAFELLERVDCHALFTVAEEVGGVGAEKVDFDFNPSYLVEVDRKGNSDIIVESSTLLADGEFETILKDEGKEFGFEPSIFGSFTDVDNLHEKYGVQSCNISAGYFSAHTTNEYVVLTDLANTISFLELLFRKYPSKYEGPKDWNATSWSGYRSHSRVGGHGGYPESSVYGSYGDMYVYDYEEDEKQMSIYMANYYQKMADSNNTYYCDACKMFVEPDDFLIHGECPFCMTVIDRNSVKVLDVSEVGTKVFEIKDGEITGEFFDSFEALPFKKCHSYKKFKKLSLNQKEDAWDAYYRDKGDSNESYFDPIEKVDEEESGEKDSEV